MMTGVTSCTWAPLVQGRRSHPGRHGHCHSRRLPVPRHHWCKVCHAIVPVSATGRNVLSAQRHIYTWKNIQGPRLFRSSSAPPANSRSFISTTVINVYPAETPVSCALWRYLDSPTCCSQWPHPLGVQEKVSVLQLQHAGEHQPSPYILQGLASAACRVSEVGGSGDAVWPWP